MNLRPIATDDLEALAIILDDKLVDAEETRGDWQNHARGIRLGIALAAKLLGGDSTGDADPNELREAIRYELRQRPYGEAPQPRCYPGFEREDGRADCHSGKRLTVISQGPVAGQRPIVLRESRLIDGGGQQEMDLLLLGWQQRAALNAMIAAYAEGDRS